MPLVLEAMPSLRETWDETENADESGPAGRLGYLDAADVVRHAVRLLAKRRRRDEVAALLAVVERLHVGGDGYVRELATIGYLEDLQGALDRHPSLTRDAVVPMLGPESLRWWHALDRFWNGEAPLVQVDEPEG